MKSIFVGSGVAIVTPFRKDGKIDYRLFSKLIEFQILNKTDAIIVCGTTGEGSTLTTDERLKLFSVAVDKVSGRIPVIAGTGSNSTSFSEAFMKEAEKTGIDAHLSVTPYYNKASQQGIIKHYFNLAESAQKPLIVYNVPSRTGVNIKPETYAILAEHDNIKAVKEADTNITKLQLTLSLCKDKLDFYSGNDDMTAVAGFIGFKGVISVLSNILPGYTHELTLASINGNINKANRMQKEAMKIIEALFSEVNPIPVKYILGKLIDEDLGFRLPLCYPDDKSTAFLDEIIDECKNKFKKEIIPF